MVDDRTRERQRIAAEAVRAVDPSTTEAWGALSHLSPDTTVDSIEVFEDEILLSDEGFCGSMLWHVTLVYREPEDTITLTESFPGKFEGVFRDQMAQITNISADTSGFFR